MNFLKTLTGRVARRVARVRPTSALCASGSGALQQWPVLEARPTLAPRNISPFMLGTHQPSTPFSSGFFGRHFSTPAGGYEPSDEYDDDDDVSQDYVAEDEYDSKYEPSLLQHATEPEHVAEVERVIRSGDEEWQRNQPVQKEAVNFQDTLEDAEVDLTATEEDITWKKKETRHHPQAVLIDPVTGNRRDPRSPPPIKMRRDEFGHSMAVGARKNAKAFVWVKPGTGECFVNKRNMADYFPSFSHRNNFILPFQAIDKVGEFDVFVYAESGGITGQAEAIKHGISRALNFYDPKFRPALKAAGLLTRDSRVVERKKFGRKKARKSFPFVKR